MAYILSEYFQKQGKKLLENSLRNVEGKPTTYVTNLTNYQQYVVQRGWQALPLPLRMEGRDSLKWDELFWALREEVFDLDHGKVAVRKDVADRIQKVVGRVYMSEDKVPKTARKEPGAVPSPSLPSQGDVPLALPVNSSSSASLAAPGTLPLFSPGAANSSIPVAAPVSQVARHNNSAHPLGGSDQVVGIDLGTTYSLVAYVDAKGQPVSISNAAGDKLTPSVVFFDKEGTIVGREAVLASALEPDRVAEWVKRDMGAKAYRKQINGEFLPPEVISSFILRSLKSDAERVLGPVRKAVITVPAYFEETRRRATMDAGRLAGLEVLDIINEPTAAAIAYGYHLGFLDRTCQAAGDKALRVLVYDLGGGTFDVTIIEIHGRDFRAQATDGDAALGGKDWDDKLVDIAAERFRKEFREDPRNNPLSLQDLRLAAEAAKRTLSERRKAPIYVNHLGTRRKVEVSREEFEEATAALLERTRLTTEIVLRQAGLTWADLDRIILVGGSTRMPMVVRMLEELTGKPIDRSISVDEAVAHGAALYACLLAPKQGAHDEVAEFFITDVNSHSLGILGSDPETGRKFNKILIPKNSPLPRTVTRVFRTFKPNQRQVVIKVLEGESDHPEICTAVGNCAIRDLPPGLPAGWPVSVSYTYAANGRLHVTARVKDHDAAVTTDITRENGIPDEDLDLWTHYIEEELQDVS